MGSLSCFTYPLAINLAFLTILLFASQALKGLAFDPTDGFTQLPLTNSNIEIQRPYNVPVNQRYSFVDGVRKMWVYSTDKPHFPGSNTKPRTEIRIKGYDYNSGIWQFEGQVYVPSGTSGVSIMQIFGATNAATTIQIRAYDDTFKYYSAQTIVTHVYDKWLQLNVIHDVGAGKVTVFVDGIKKLEVNGREGNYHYFKFGVYAQTGDSHCMESRWKGVKIYRKED